MWMPNATWGEMRELHRIMVESGEVSADDWLSDPEVVKSSASKKDSDYIYDISDKEAEEWNKIANGEDVSDIAYHFTLSDNNKPLEIIMTDYDAGEMFVRAGSQWEVVNQEIPNPNIFEVAMIEIDSEKIDGALSMWDNREQPPSLMEISIYEKERQTNG